MRRDSLVGCDLDYDAHPEVNADVLVWRKWLAITLPMPSNTIAKTSREIPSDP
jgi:hypothetical protein